MTESSGEPLYCTSPLYLLTTQAGRLGTAEPDRTYPGSFCLNSTKLRVSLESAARNR